MNAIRLLCCCVVVSTGCVLPELVPEAKGEFVATGSVQRGTFGASFDKARVVSPSVTLSRRTDGSWGGRFALAGSGDPVGIDVSVTDTTARGVDFVMRKETPEPGKTIISGAFKNRSFHFEISKDAIVIHTFRHSAAYYGRVERGDGSAVYGQEGAMVLTGDAAVIDPVAWPQLGFALFAAYY
jgi:hypothetical protein